MLFIKNKVIRVVGLLGLCLFVFGIFLYVTSNNLDREAPLISDEVNRYLAMEFEPKYRVDECVVRFALHLKDKKRRYLEEVNLAFWRYITKHEPKIGTMVYQNYIWPDHFVYFADQCDRRDEIFSGMAANVEKHFGDWMTIQRMPIEAPVKGFMGLWTDGPGYRPDYWPVYHKAVRGDGKAFLDLLRFEHKVDNEREYLLYSLAEHYLPRGALKDKAREGKEGAWGEIKPEHQERQKMVIENWKQTIQRYNSQ